jgi:hypothetical protein
VLQTSDLRAGPRTPLDETSFGCTSGLLWMERCPQPAQEAFGQEEKYAHLQVMCGVIVVKLHVFYLGSLNHHGPN